MSAAADYAYLHGRVSLLAEGLISQDQLLALLDCTVDEEPKILHAASLPQLDPSVISDANLLEQGLITDLVEDFITLGRALTGTARDLLVYWARRFELSNLKAIIRGKMAQESLDTIHSRLIDIGPFASLPVEKLARTEDVAELLRVVETTPYADIARQARRVYEKQQQLFALDAAIDRRYFVGLTKRAKTAGTGDSEPLRALIGSIIDRTNLSWLLRYRFAYELAPAEAYYLLIPAGYLLDSHMLLKLAQLNDIPEVISQLPPALASRLDGATTVIEVDREMERASDRVASSVLRRTAFNLARAFAYLVLRERDLLRCHAVLKGKRLKIDPDTIRQASGLDDNDGIDAQTHTGAAIKVH